jgi:S1-C subfamily serine protease
VNVVDLVILALVALGFTSGYKRGVVMQLFSWGGFILGLIGGAFAATTVTRAVNPSPNLQTVLVLVVLFGTAFVVEALVVLLGARAAAKLTAVNARSVDKWLGSVVAGVLALVLVWMASAPAKQVRQLAGPVRKSAILKGMYAMLSTPPNFVAAIGGFLNKTGFPEVFAGLNPSFAPGVDPPPASLAHNQNILAARALVFKIESDGCGGRVDGSGWPSQPHLVITAAHVVAGTKNTHIIRGSGGSYRATVVYMDTNKDIAVLRVPSMPSETIPLDAKPATKNTDGAAVGYPGGGSEKVTPARVRARTKALGRDIYSSGRTSREIYILRAHVIQGNSGGPFVDTGGRVRGMIFAASKENADESYALAETEIEAALRKAGARTAAVATGRCAI